MRAVTCILAAAVHGAAFADGIQAQCGPEKGIGFMATQGGVEAADGGWYEDGITSGETVVRIDTDSGNVDIRFKDASNLWQSVNDSAAMVKVVTAQDEPPSFMVLVVYPRGAVEVLTLAEMSLGKATLIHSLSRTTTIATSSRIFTASCVVTTY